MDKQTQELLDFHNIRNELMEYALSPEGRALVARQEFLYDAGELENLLDRAGEWRMLLDLSQGAPAFDFPELDFLRQAEKEGSVLEGIQAAALGRYIQSSAALRKYLSRRPENRQDYAGLLLEEAAELPDLTKLAGEIFHNLDEQGQIVENHPALKPIRKNIDRVARELRELSYKYLQSEQDIWQNEVPTVRDGRMVLPLKTNYRGKVKGIIHEYSSKGGTVFIEPFDVVEKNNQAAMLESQLRAEELKILRELTASIRERLPECHALRDKIAALDSSYVRARYAHIHECVRPEILDRGFRLKEARHPSLGKRAVPISFSMGQETEVLIITGPNTGGKTVALKTAGLFVMMHQFGLEIPAVQGSGLALFRGVYADIGDDQSIEASLSTFSGHMNRYAFIMSACEGQSCDGNAAAGPFAAGGAKDALVLLDELGGGTDPQEGAALAMAVLDWFVLRKIPVICTTHLGVMKNYGYTRPGAVNASVTFDEDSLRPTYHILEGIPGESHALEIASSNGIGGEIIKEARAYLEQDKSSISGMIRELQDSQRKVYLQEKDLEKRRKELNESYRDLSLRELALRQKEAELRSEDNRELKRYIRESRKQLENLVAGLVRSSSGGEENAGLAKEDTKRVKEFVNALGDKLRDEEVLEEERQRLIAAGSDFSPQESDTGADELLTGVIEEGSEVRVLATGKTGTIIRKERKGKWLVALGTFKVAYNQEELALVKVSKTAKTSYQLSAAERSGGPGRYASLELDLRGMRLEEALRVLDEHIDACLLSGLNNFSVIHGLGEGILQKGVRDYLASSPVVRSFQFAHPDQGGFGKTEVQL